MVLAIGDERFYFEWGVTYRPFALPMCGKMACWPSPQMPALIPQVSSWSSCTAGQHVAVSEYGSI